MPSNLASLVGAIESGNNPNASLTDYAGNVSVNAQYQQSAGWIAQYGAGASGIDNEASQLLAKNPNATLGDFYSAYNHGSVLPWSQYSSSYPQQANNFLSNAKSQGYDQNTPLSQLTGASSTNPNGASGAGLTDDDLVDDNYDYGSLNSGSSTINASSADQYSLMGAGDGSVSGAGVGYNATSAGASGLGGGQSLFGDTSGDSVTYAPSTAAVDAGIDAEYGGASPSASTGAGLLGTAGTSPTGAAGGQAISTGTGQPVNITDLGGLDTSVTGAGKAAQAGATTAGTDIQQSASGIAGTAASALNSIEGYASGAVIVIALVLLGLVFVAFGLGMFKHNIIPAAA